MQLATTVSSRVYRYKNLSFKPYNNPEPKPAPKPVEVIMNRSAFERFRLTLNKEERQRIVEEEKEKITNLYHYTVDLFNSNIKFLIYQSGYNVAEFYQLMNSKGYKLKIKSLKNRSRSRNGHPLTLLTICTFAHIFNIDPGILISVDLKKTAQEQEENSENTG